MQRTHLPNVTLIAAAASYLIQIGAGFFALATIASTVSAAPPRSLAILHGAYPYDSSFFWQTVPPITAALLLLAVVEAAAGAALLVALTRSLTKPAVSPA